MEKQTARQRKSADEQQAKAFLEAFWKNDPNKIAAARKRMHISITGDQAQSRLAHLVSAGCDRELILASCLVLSRRANRWRMSNRYAFQKKPQDLKRMAESLRKLLSDPFSDPRKFYSKEEADRFSEIPDLLEDYWRLLDERTSLVCDLFGKHFVRQHTLIMIGEHLKLRSRAYHWEDLAYIIDQFHPDGASCDAGSLERAYQRARKKHPWPYIPR